MKLAVFLVLSVLYATVHCATGIPANARVILVDENYDTTDQQNMVAACPTCTFTVVENALSDSPNFFDNPIDPNYDMLVYLKSDDDWDNYTPESLTWKTNIENFANLGRVVLFTQYDMLASSEDSLLIDIVGGLGSEDCSGYDGAVPDPYPTNVPECDLILNGGFFDLRGLTAGVEVDPDWGVNSFPSDLDCEVLNPGISFPCMTSADYDPVNSVIWAVRPMSNQGAVVWLSIDDDDNLSWYSNPTSVYYLAFNNMLSFAEAVAGGDPHITTFDHEKFELDGENFYNLFRDSNVAINVHTKKFGKGASFIDEVGISFEGHQLHAYSRAGHLQFFLDGMKLTEGSTALDGAVSLSNYAVNRNDELARYLQVSLRLFYKGYTVSVDGGFYQELPFFNVAVKEHHNLELATRDIVHPGLFQTHSVNQLREVTDHDSLADFVVPNLFARD